MAEKENNVLSSFSIENFDKNNSLWSDWIIRLECQLNIQKVKEDGKLAHLYSLMGAEAFGILRKKILPKKPMEITFKEANEVMKKHYEPESLKIFEVCKFQKMLQEESETIADFVSRLRQQATKCDYESYNDNAIRNQLVLGVKEKKIQQKLYETDSLTLEKAIQLAEVMETVLRGKEEIIPREIDFIDKKHPAKRIGNDEASSSNSGGESSKKTKCYRCGGSSHLANVCRFKSLKCNFCQKNGHTYKVCFKRNQNINVDENDIKNIETFEKYKISLNVNDFEVGFEIDSGCPVTIINNNLRRRYFNHLPLHKTVKSFRSYCGSPIKVLGILKVMVKSHGKSFQLPMYVVESNRSPLLGREWLQKLKIDWNKFIYNCNSITPVVMKTTKESFMQKYPSVFDKSIGKIEGIQAHLTLKENAKPVFIKNRTMPFSLRDPVEKELNHLVEQGILRKVDFSTWATPIVPVKKANNKVRICGDYKITVNPNLLIPEYPLPTIEELFADMAGGIKFTKIDLTQAYLQLSVNENDCEFLTLSTHVGLFRPTRLMYGIASAPAIFQKTIEQILKGIPGVKVFLDDIKITGKSMTDHINNVNEVLSRLNQYNIKANIDKCEFFADKIEYCGYVIDCNGISKIKEKVEAIQRMPNPKNREEVRSFLGLVNYYGRFIENMSELIYPITNLVKLRTDFVWSKECQKSFDTIKQELMSDKILVHYDPSLPLVLATDASNYAVGAVLSHIMPDGTERPIRYASQTLSETQQRYAMVDKEAYAIIFGVKKFYQYVYNRQFTLHCDSKPVTQIFANNKGLPVLSATRMQHYAIYLQAFDYDIRYRRSEENSNADGLSRLPITESCIAETDDTDVLEVELINSLPVTSKMLAQETRMDTSVKKLVKGLEKGITVDKKHRFNINQEEFTLQQGCLMRNSRAYIPETLREKILNELHSAHFGISRMKSLARTYCWWYGLDKDIEDLVKNCVKCQVVKPDPAKVETHIWEPATKPFERIHIDFAGPLRNGAYFLIIVDAYSKWIDVDIMRTTTTEATIKVLRRFFSDYGIPLYLVSDNGPQFTSEAFQNFLKSNGVFHKRGAPYHPATNGQAERCIQTIKQKLKSLETKSIDELEKNVRLILTQYRITKHATTEESPSERVFGRTIRSRLDLVMPTEEKSENEYVVEKEIRSLSMNERVSARNYSRKGEKWKFGTVIKRLGQLHYLIKMDNGFIWKRHIDQTRTIGNKCKVETPSENKELQSENNQTKVTYSCVVPNEEPQLNLDNRNDIENELDITDNTYESCDSEQNSPQRSSPLIRRSNRNRRLPTRFQDYNLDEESNSEGENLL